MCRILRSLRSLKALLPGRLLRKEEGATLAEYGLLLVLIAVVCLAAITLLGTKISEMYHSLSTSI
jgi:pilus assembly protein Flp/PilA